MDPGPDEPSDHQPSPGFTRSTHAFAHRAFWNIRIAYVAELLEPILVALQQSTDCEFLLVGRGSENYAAHLLNRHPQFASSLQAPFIVDDRALSAAIGSCDLVVQPYPDGVSTRRGSAMASLALGVPIVTHSGASTESIWAESGAVLLAISAAASDYLASVLLLSGDRAARELLAERGLALYSERFALEHTITALRAGAVDSR